MEHSIDEDISDNYFKYIQEKNKYDKLLILFNEKDKELETYKKIAEKLADTLRYYNGMQQVQEFCIDICEDKLCDEENCKQCIIDWARKEVENE